MDKSHTLVLGGCIGGIVVGLVGILLVATLLSAAVALVTGGGNGASGGCLPEPPAPVAAQRKQATISPTPSPTGLTMCVHAGGIAAAVVQLALQMALHLYVNPACGSTRNFPDCYYTWYDSGFPKEVIAYGNRICPGCAAWADGNYQCVSFVRGAYSQSYPMDQTADAFFLWGMYQNKPGWMEIAANPQAQTPTIHLGPPLPGDIVVMKDNSAGHVAIITAVSLPDAQGNRMVTFANANSIRPLDHMTVHTDLMASRPPGWAAAYVVWGYIRPAVRGDHEAGFIPDNPSVPVARQDGASVGISPGLIVRQINEESGFHPSALGPVVDDKNTRAEGIGQFLPQRASQVGIDLWEPVASLKAAANVMAGYQRKYGGDEAKVELLLVMQHTATTLKGLLIVKTLFFSLLHTPFLLASISGFFNRLAGDVTAFALSASIFFFAWAAILYMTAGHNERRMEYARGSLYAALGGLALALLSTTIATLVSNAAQGQ